MYGHLNFKHFLCPKFKNNNQMGDFSELIQKALLAMTWVEIGAVTATFIYVILAAKESIWCWIFGIVGAILWAYAAYNFFNLYIDALLQLYYVFVSIYGWYEWNRGGKKRDKLEISRLSVEGHFKLIAGGFASTLIAGYFFGKYTAAASTYLDAFTTVFSIITTYLVTRKILENWLYWVVIDAVYIYLYFSREGYLFALLNVVFVGISVIGYFNWRRKMEREQLIIKRN
jgi:nicotinamide mononucleotide transporter